MKLQDIFIITLLCTAASTGYSQTQPISLNGTPSRGVGQPQLFPESGAANRVEGREFYDPQGIAFDTTASPPIVYVADLRNNRVLAWKNSTGFGNGAPADLVIGQPDQFSTGQLGPGSQYSTGLTAPTGLTVDAQGNLYVADSGNNRILRFPKPFAQQTGQILPDLWIGQPSLNSRNANYTGQVSGSGIFLATSNAVFQAGLAFDSSGNLWLTDPGNSRVLRFPAASLTCSGNGCNPTADTVIGQPNLITPPGPALTTSQAATKSQFGTVNSLAIDSLGRLYVSDVIGGGNNGLGRVLVFSNPSAQSGNLSADRIMGVIQNSQLSGIQQSQLAAFVGSTQMANPNGIFFLADRSVGVVDSGWNRITIFPPYEKWPAESTYFSPQASTVVGQADFVFINPNKAQVGSGAVTPPANATTLWAPYAAAFLSSTSELFITDSGNNRMVVMPQTANGFGPATRVLGQDNMGQSSPNLIEGKEFNFNSDAAIALDTSGATPHLWVSDPSNHRVLGFHDARQLTPSSVADIVIGQPDGHTALCNYPSGSATAPTQTSLCAPLGIAVDGSGNLYVADSGNSRVLRFPNPWTWYANNKGMEPADLVLGQFGFTTSVAQPGANTMGTPYGIAFSGTSGIVVSDNQYNRVLFIPFSGNGTFNGGSDNGKAATKVFGQPNFTTIQKPAGNALNQMNGPRGITCDSTGQIYVADTGNNRILVFPDPNNSQTLSNASAQVQIPGLGSPRDVYVNSGTGEIWVTNTGAGTLVRYPKYETLIFNSTPTATIQNAVNNTLIPALAVAQDQYGDLFVADNYNQVIVYYQGFAYVNAATSLVRPLSPGMIATLYPLASATQFGANTQTNSNTTWPTSMGDIQVTVNGTPAPIDYISPGQINFFVPQNTPVNTNAEVEVIQMSTGQVLGAEQAQVAALAPGLFTTCQANQTGNLREVCVLNQDNTVNSSSNPAARGSVVQIFGTGQGPVSSPPADGAPASSSTLSVTQGTARVIMNTCYTDECGPAQPGDVGTSGSASSSWVPFSGLAPGFVGLWQVNAQIPMAVPPSSQTGQGTLLVVVINNVPSSDTTSGFRTYFYVK